MELNNSQLDQVAGGGGTKKDKNLGDYVRCPNCGTKIEIDKDAGRTVTCTKCGTPVEI